MSNQKKALTKQYKETPRQMGVYQIRNVVNGKMLIGGSPNIPGIFNRHKFALLAGAHDNKQLQADWQEVGQDNFSFEVLDELSPTEGADYDYREDLTFLEDMWLEKLEPYGDRGYNVRKKGREEKLRMITENRRGAE